jgi:hypothetical protein
MTARCKADKCCSIGQDLAGPDWLPWILAGDQADLTGTNGMQLLRHRKSSIRSRPVFGSVWPGGSAQVKNQCKIRGTKILQNIFVWILGIGTGLPALPGHPFLRGDLRQRNCAINARRKSLQSLLGLEFRFSLPQRFRAFPSIPKGGPEMGWDALI